MTFWRSYAHLVWTTKNREPLIQPAIEKDIYAHMVKRAAELGCYTHAINGVSDHVHVIISIPPKHSVSWVVKDMKGACSHFVNHILRPYPQRFAWQAGYGYLTLGESQSARAIAYVENQKQHHRDNTTNRWLEKTEEDELPTPDEFQAGHTLREGQAMYIVNDDFPF